MVNKKSEELINEAHGSRVVITLTIKDQIFKRGIMQSLYIWNKHFGHIQKLTILDYGPLYFRGSDSFISYHYDVENKCLLCFPLTDPQLYVTHPSFCPHACTDSKIHGMMKGTTHTVRSNRRPPLQTFTFTSSCHSVGELKI